jgi:hypothetical protein
MTVFGRANIMMPQSAAMLTVAMDQAIPPARISFMALLLLMRTISFFINGLDYP